MIVDFTIGQNDILPELEVTLVDDNQVAVPLDGAGSIKFHMMQQDQSVPKVDDVAVFVDKATGKVKYTWKAADTDTDGIYFGEFEVTWTAGGTTTFPNNSYIVIKVHKEIA